MSEPNMFEQLDAKIKEYQDLRANLARVLGEPSVKETTKPAAASPAPAVSVVRKTAEKTTSKASKVHDAILKYLEERGGEGAQAGAIGQFCGMSGQDLSRMLKSMADNGEIRREGERRATRYWRVA